MFPLLFVLPVLTPYYNLCQFSSNLLAHHSALPESLGGYILQSSFDMMVVCDTIKLHNGTPVQEDEERERNFCCWDVTWSRRHYSEMMIVVMGV